jgi:hypothetical protein
MRGKYVYSIMTFALLIFCSLDNGNSDFDGQKHCKDSLQSFVREHSQLPSIWGCLGDSAIVRYKIKDLLAASRTCLDVFLFCVKTLFIQTKQHSPLIHADVVTGCEPYL